MWFFPRKPKATFLNECLGLPNGSPVVEGTRFSLTQVSFSVKSGFYNQTNPSER
jgi:hypothetical protein